MKKKKKPIKIDISNIDTKSVKKQAYFLQEEGFEKVSELLTKEIKGKKTKDFSNLQRSHNTIFINGQRGSGKTQFLISIKNYLKNNNKKTLKKLYFIKSVDPTLLHDNESFLTIILAKILNQLEAENKLNDLSKEDKSEFYQHLMNVSSAIDGVIHKHNQSKSSLEHISQDQTSLRLEKYLNEFFYKVTQIIQKRKIVLLIDDIDMAFEKGFKVLEVIRKYLSSIYITPIVTGDIKLYHQIIETHFQEHINNKINIEKLAKDYLVKVLPTYKRIQIQTLYQLSKNRELNFKFNNDSYPFKCYSCDSNTLNEDNYFYNLVEDVFLIETFRKVFIKNLFSNQLRNIIQFLHNEYTEQNSTFSLTSLESIEKVENDYELTLLHEVKSWKSYFEEGKSFFQKNEWEKAIEYFIESLEINANEEVHYYLGNSYYNLNLWSNAQKEYNNVIELNSKNSEAFFKLGDVYRKTKIYPAAKYHYQKSIELNPKNYNAYNRLGMIYIHLEKIGLAIKNFHLAINLEENNHRAYINIIEVSLLTNQDYANEDFKNKYENNFKNSDIAMKPYDMLKIFNMIKENIDSEIINIEFTIWKSKYEEVTHLEWSFQEIEEFTTKLKNKKIQQNFMKYIEEFKKFY